MKKTSKIWTSLFAFVLIITGAMCLTACGTKQEKVTEIVVLDQMNLSKVYDGKPVGDPFIYSIIGEEKFEYSIDWYSGDTKLSASPVNAGQYKLLITINYGTKTETLEKEFEIEKCKVSIPDAPNLTYNGKMQYPFDDIDKNIIQVTGQIGSDINSNGDLGYDTTFSLKDKTNYIWEDNTSYDKTINWTIARKELDKIIEVKKSYDGINEEYIKLTEEHGLFEEDCNKGLYLQVTFESSEVGASVSSYAVLLKKGDTYTAINVTGSDGLYYHYAYYVNFEVYGEIV